MTLRDSIKNELNDLLKQGIIISKMISKEKEISAIKYQKWYTKASSVIKQLLPDKSIEFNELYKTKKTGKTIRPADYTISDYFIGIRNPQSKIVFYNKFIIQLGILSAVNDSFNSLLSDVVNVLQAELLDNEIDAAKELFKTKHLRAAGTIAAVVLESHLSSICKNHNITIEKKNPNIGNYNDALKNNQIIDIPIWRGIQRLSDIRSYCCHKKERDPTPDEVQELINGTEKVITTLH